MPKITIDTDKIGEIFNKFLYKHHSSHKVIKDIADYFEKEADVPCPKCKSADTYESRLNKGYTFRCNYCGIYFDGSFNQQQFLKKCGIG